MAVVNNGQRWQTTVDHRRTTGQPPVNANIKKEEGASNKENDHNVQDFRDKFRNKTGSYMSRMDGRTCNIKQKCVKSQTPRQAKRGRDTKIPQSGGPPEKVGDEAIHKELGDKMEKGIGDDTVRHKLNTIVSNCHPEVKTTTESLVYIRRSASKEKDKGKAIMKEVEPVQKNTKLQLEQERLGYEEALRLQE
ncbi:hypothetical protein Tco_0431335 [Tanacetum coccineum]